ncbi:hypothetical protein VNI00_008461 [Paramarasmius palmivorus]|uniref:DUF6533 domain-containing protein n=1 Tax=Paramarasmius palmivorus TaxID=297713 RepID=A0AAW0CW49_9AGAR
MLGVSSLTYAIAGAITDGEPVTVELVATGLWLIHVLQVYTSAMVTLAVWDWLACLQMEWERIWKREWSLVKVLYLWTRYYGLFSFAINLWLFNGDFTIERCKTLHYIIAASCMWTTLGCEAILAIRTYAFLGKRVWTAVLLIVMLLGETAFLLYVAIKAVYQSPLPYGTSGPCTATDFPGKHVVMGFWLAPVLFDLICTILTGAKAINIKRLGVKSDIVKVFVREGLFYFIAAFMFQSNVNIQNINSFLALVLSQVLCCRLVLNLRSGSESQMSTQSQTPTPNPPRNHTTIRSNFNIPLSTFHGSSGDHGDDVYAGIKVDVEQIQSDK